MNIIIVFRCAQVSVKTHLGKTIILDLQSKSKIDNIKTQIEATEGIPADEQRLLHGGKQLDNTLTLAHYNIMNQAQLHLVIRHKMPDASFKEFASAEGEVSQSSADEVHFQRSLFSQINSFIKYNTF